MEGCPTPRDWQSWLEEHAARFLLFARQKVRSEADAQDLMQEAIIEAARRNHWHGPPAPALVFATIHRRAIDWARREERRSARERVAAEDQSAVWFDSTVEERERAVSLQESLEKLPDYYRDVISLKVWGGLTFAEVGEALNIPANTAASRYRYGLEELRKRTREVLL